jgi:hypothetical protein
MGAMVKLAGLLFGKLTFCALNGALVGVLAGFLFGAHLLEHPTHILTPAEILQIAVILTLICWFVVLVIVGLWLHYGARAIAAALLLNALLTVVLTVWLNNMIRIPEIAGLIGLLVGILVGTVLCRFCRRFPERTTPNG